jgi:hypothetical protein
VERAARQFLRVSDHTARALPPGIIRSAPEYRDGTGFHQVCAVTTSTRPSTTPRPLTAVRYHCSLCGGDLDRDVRIDVWDEDSISKADQIGLAKFPAKSLLTKERITLIDYKVC